MSLSKKENFMEKGYGKLQDETRVMQMTQGFLKRNLLEIFKKRKWEESNPGKSDLDQLRELRNISGIYSSKDWDPD